jgi:hypothetical protein
MRLFLLLALSVVLFSSCANYEKKDLYGTWSSPEMTFVFNADETFKMDLGLNKVEGKFHTFGNNIELINPEGKVVFTVLLKSLKDNELTINIPSMGTDRLYTMKKTS